jgi:BirA family biotin operon repressor/biotin-[acetyl-CoA-carboxylase] ligase
MWVVATRQTGGRGRQGRVWSSPPGNLYASLALRLSIEPAVAPQLGFVAGVALAGVLRDRLAGDGRLRIKWPNDMIFDGAKLAGLLLECTSLPDGQLGCVVGFGVNCRSHPEGLPYPAIDLAAAGDPAPDPKEILSALAEAMARQLAIWDKGLEFNAIRSAWLSLAIDLQTRLGVTLAERRLSGTFQGLDPTGRLLLDTDGGRLAIDAGDVFLPDMVGIFDKNQSAAKR